MTRSGMIRNYVINVSENEFELCNQCIRKWSSIINSVGNKNWGGGALLPLTTRRRPRHITLSEARSRLYQHRFLQPNTHFSAFFEIYKIIWLNFQNSPEICESFEICKHFANFWRIWKIQPNNFVDLEKCRKMSISLQKSALIQPRTSLGKSAVSWLDPWWAAQRESRAGNTAAASPATTHHSF